ncbi:MAG: hypothetical protein Q8K95_09375, partial [Nitrosomonas sp.]|nr:hypothetical protein [Nitrosomonas sp.]
SNDNAYIWHTTGSGKTLTSFKASHLEVVIADTLYGSRDNRSYLERKHIRFAGKPLGRPPKSTPENKDEIKRLKGQNSILGDKKVHAQRNSVCACLPIHLKPEFLLGSAI